MAIKRAQPSNIPNLDSKRAPAMVNDEIRKLAQAINEIADVVDPPKTSSSPRPVSSGNTPVAGNTVSKSTGITVGHNGGDVVSGAEKIDFYDNDVEFVVTKSGKAAARVDGKLKQRRVLEGVVECTTFVGDYNMDDRLHGRHYMGTLRHDWHLTPENKWRIAITPVHLGKKPSSCVPILTVPDGDSIEFHIIRKDEGVNRIEGYGLYKFEYRIVEARDDEEYPVVNVFHNFNNHTSKTVRLAESGSGRKTEDDQDLITE